MRSYRSGGEFPNPASRIPRHGLSITSRWQEPSRRVTEFDLASTDSPVRKEGSRRKDRRPQTRARDQARRGDLNRARAESGPLVDTMLGRPEPVGKPPPIKNSWTR